MLRKASGVLGLLVLLLGLAVAGGGVVVADDPEIGVEYQYDQGDDLFIQLPTVQNGIKRLVLQADSTHTVVYKRELATTWPWDTADTSTESLGSYTVTAPQNIEDPNDPDALCCCHDAGSTYGHYSSYYRDCVSGTPLDCEIITMLCDCHLQHCPSGTIKLVVPND